MGFLCGGEKDSRCWEEKGLCLNVNQNQFWDIFEHLLWSDLLNFQLISTSTYFPPFFCCVVFDQSGSCAQSAPNAKNASKVMEQLIPSLDRGQ